MTTETPAADETAIVEVPESDLEIVPAIPQELVEAGIFSHDPIAAIEQARRIATHMQKLIAPRRKDFICQIKGRTCPMDPWWTAMGQTLGLSPVLMWTRKFEPMWDRTEGYESRTEVRHRSGAVVSAGQGVCLMDELVWDKKKGRDVPRSEAGYQTHAIYSYSATRSRVRAYKGPLSFLAVLAGLEPVPAEEMGSGERTPPKPEVILAALPEDVATMARELKWTNGQVKAELHQFLIDDGRVDADKARTHLNRALDVKIAAEEDRRLA